MPILLNDSLDVQAPRSTDNRFGPYSNTTAALAAVPLTQRYVGLTIGILDVNNYVQDYWFNGGTANSNFVLKIDGATANVTSDAYNRANLAANTVRVSANYSSVQNNVSINFNTTPTVNVAVTPGLSGNANIELTVNTTGSGIVTAQLTAENAYGQANSARDQANTARNTANGAYSQANTALDTANNAYGQANLAYGQANSARDQANSAYSQANIAANTVSVTVGGLTLDNKKLFFQNTSSLTIELVEEGANANLILKSSGGIAYDIANLAYAQANAARDQANTARGTANDAYLQANTARDTANGAYGQANTALSTANDAYAQANTARNTANDAYGQANTARNTANDAYGQANTARSTANDAYLQANTARDQANTARNTANAAYGQANLAYTQANNAYDAANLKLNLTGGTVSGDLTVQGNLFLVGNATYINVATLKVNDSIIQLSSNSTSDAVDIGFVGHYSDDGGVTKLHSGLIRHASDNVFYVFDGYPNEPTNNVIDVASANLAWLRANVNAASLLINGNAVATQANLTIANAQANAAYGQANAAYSQANAAANTVAVYANDSLVISKANTNFNNSSTVNVSITPNVLTGRANIEFSVNTTSTGVAAAYDAANSAANTVKVSANTGSTINSVSLNFNNTSTVNVTVGAGTAGNANVSFQINPTGSGITTAQSTAEDAYNQANSAANTVAIFANGSLVLTRSNVNFNNSATVNVNVTANGTSQSNVEFTVNTTSTGIVAAYNQANAAYNQANNAYAAANNAAVRVSANSGSALSSNTLVFNNTATVTVSVTQNGTNANIEFQTAGLNDTYTAAGNTTAASSANIANGLYAIATAAYAKANAPITIKEIYASNSTVINTFNNINTIQFDADSGMAVVDESSNTVTIQLNSTFKNWEVDGNPGLIAFGLDTVNFISGNGISITANNANTPKSIRFDSTTSSSTLVSDKFIGNGAQTAFYLSGTPTSQNSLFVFIDGVTQVPATDYYLSSNVLNFLTAPESGGVIEARSIISIQTISTTNNHIHENNTYLTVSDSTLTFTAGGFSSNTDSQNKTYILKGTTTDGTETELSLNGYVPRIAVSTNTTVFYTADIVARRTDVIGESAGYHIKGVVDNFSGVVSDVGNLYEVAVAEDDLDYVVDARADDTNNTINIYVTGEAGKTIRWTALVRTVEVAQ